jgi:acetolactate synthase-1/2/3 large subunit
MKVSDYLCDYLLARGIDTIFCVTGGTLAHILNSIKQRPEITIYFNYCESGCSMAAEAYQKASGKVPLVLTTNGPGATNAITGVVGAFHECVPLLVISGQCYANQVLSVVAPDVRSLGAQELHVLPVVGSFTKYCEQVRDAHRVAYILDTALYHMLEGRPGPVWLDFPLDIQAIEIEPLQLLRGPAPYSPSAYTDPLWYEQILTKLRTSKKPLLYIGHGVRGANASAELNRFARLLNVPVAATWTAIDILDTDNKKALYIGSPGIMGEPAACAAFAAADFVLAVGTRLSASIAPSSVLHGNADSWKALVNIDAAELTKPNVNIDLRIACDCKVFLGAFLEAVGAQRVHRDDEWLHQLQALRRDDQTVKLLESAANPDGLLVTPHSFVGVLSDAVRDDTCIVSGCGGLVYTSLHQAFRTERENVRLLSSSGTSQWPRRLAARQSHRSAHVPLVAAAPSAAVLDDDMFTVEPTGSLQSRVRWTSACRGSAAQP